MEYTTFLYLLSCSFFSPFEFCFSSASCGSDGPSTSTKASSSSSLSGSASSLGACGCWWDARSDCCCGMGWFRLAPSRVSLKSEYSLPLSESPDDEGPKEGLPSPGGVFEGEDEDDELVPEDELEDEPEEELGDDPELPDCLPCPWAEVTASLCLHSLSAGSKKDDHS